MSEENIFSQIFSFKNLSPRSSNSKDLSTFPKFTKINSSQETDSPDGWCPQGNGCAFDNCEKVYETTIGGCPDRCDPKDGSCNPEEEEPNLYITWVWSIPECQDSPGFSCKRVNYVTRECRTDGYSTWEAELFDCDGQPPAPSCEPTGHGEGVEGFEYECTDGVNNDCDYELDCVEQRCSLRQECLDQCDADRDGIRDKPCRGPDCFPQDPLLPKKVNGQFVESNCYDGIDDDCQQDGEDCYDSDCRSQQGVCPPSQPENCYDGVDNDYDRKIDCLDDDCCSIRTDCQQSNPEVCPPPTPSPTPTPGGNGGGGEECPCGDCVNGCSSCDCGDCIYGCEENCGWVTVEGQCYGGVAF